MGTARQGTALAVPIRAQWNEAALAAEAMSIPKRQGGRAGTYFLLSDLGEPGNFYEGSRLRDLHRHADALS
jgi:hypothetical protein